MLTDYIFGKLDVNYCIFFNLISFIGILLAVFVLVLLFLYPKLLKTKDIFFAVILCLFLYFQNRILYNMCINKKHILEANTVQEIDFKNQRGIELEGGKVSGEIFDKLQQTNKAWNEKYPDIKLNMGVIQTQLDKIDKNTRPLQYISNTNIVNK